MILHTHTILQNEQEVDVYVLHVNAEEAANLSVLLINAIEESPESEAFSITLGAVEQQPVRQSDIITPDSRLIVP